MWLVVGHGACVVGNRHQVPARSARAFGPSGRNHQEDHQENLLENPQEEMDQGEMTLAMMTNLRIQTTIQRTTKSEVILLHQGDPQHPPATTGTNLTQQHGEPTHPGQKPWAKECQKSATMPSMNAFMKPFRMQLVKYSDGHQSGTYMYLKTIAAGTPLPIYNGEDDLQVFMPWIHRLMCYFDLHQIVGTGHDHTRTTILYGALLGHAEMWYEHSVRTRTRSIHVFPPDFVMILLRLTNRFITPAVVTKAQSGFDKVIYPMTVGIQAYIHELERISYYL